MTLHLTAAEWKRIAAAGSGVLFRESLCPGGGDLCGGYEPHRLAVPPAEFVEAAQRCDHEGHEYLTNMNFGQGQVAACNLCKSIDGKRRVAVVVPCDACKATGRISQQHLNWNDTPCRECDQATEPYQWPSGFVTVGHVVVTWGPLVVREWNACRREQDQMNDSHVCVPVDIPADAEERPRLVLDGRWSHLTLPPDIDPATLVGQYAIGVEVVS